MSFSSIVGDATCPLGTAEGTRYLEVTAQVGGAEGVVCDADYSPVLEALASTLWSSVPYALSATPDPATISVSADEGSGAETLDPAAWVYNAAENTVRLRTDDPPAEGATLEISYTAL